MNTPIEVLLTVAGIGGRLGIAGDKLRTMLPSDCPPELKEAIRSNKTALLDLMRLTFLLVQSGALNTVVFFVPDEANKRSLAMAGADYGSIYTAVELEVLVRRKITV